MTQLLPIFHLLVALLFLSDSQLVELGQGCLRIGRAMQLSVDSRELVISPLGDVSGTTCVCCFFQPEDGLLIVSHVCQTPAQIVLGDG